MGLLTDFERKVLELSRRGSTDYRIARDLSSDVSTVSRSRKNALRKLQEAEEDLVWARSLGFEDFKTMPRRTVLEKPPELRPAF